MARRKPPARRPSGARSSTRTPTRHGRGVRVGATVIIAALVLSLVGGLLATAGGGGDDDATTELPSPTPAPPFPKLAPTLVPDGLDLQAIVDLGETPSVGGVPTTYFFFGSGADDDPFAERDVVLGVTVGLGPDLGFDPSEGTLTVGEDPAVDFVDPLTGADGISWSPADGEAWSLLSRTLAPAELAELAAELSESDDLQTLADGELELVAISDSLLGALTGPGDGTAATAGHNIVYGTDGATERSLSFWALPSDGAGLLASRWVLGEGAEPVTLGDGTPALAGTLDVTPGADGSATVAEAVTYFTLEWELEGVAMSIAAVGVGLDELVSMADSVRLLGDSEWDALVDLTAG